MKSPVGRQRCAVGHNRDLGAREALCDFGLLTTPLWASTAESVHETGSGEASQLCREDRANAVLLAPGLSMCGPYKCSLSITLEPVRNADSQAPPDPLNQTLHLNKINR